MIINTGKVISSSSILFNQVKENDSSAKITSADESKKKNSSRIFTDFAETNYSDNAMKNKFLTINNYLTQYENDLSRLQFAEQKINELQHLQGNLGKNEIEKFINEAKFNDEKVLAIYFPDINNYNEYITEAKNKIQNELKSLSKDFKQIEITSQNLTSLFTHKAGIDGENLKTIDLNDLIKNISIDKKRVLDLIS